MVSSKFSCVLTLAFAACGYASAEPSFSRKYKADCTLCHTVYPKLNRAGYQFRRLGYRFPGEMQWKSNPAPQSSTLKPAPSGSAADVQAGRELFQSFKCGSCHTVEGRGGKTGPALEGVGNRRSSDYISAQIARPKSHNPNSIMPPAPATPAQIQQIVAYLESLSGSEGASLSGNVLDYVGLSWIPTIRLEQAGGNTDANYDTRTLFLFAAGTLGSHLSMFVESNPASTDPGLGGKWNEAQGLLNFGGTSDFSQVRFGQLFTLQGDGFGGTDRFFSDSLPLIYLPVNGFAAARLGRGASAEYTFGPSTTVKVFGVDGTDGSPSFGGVWEQLIGKEGLSGISAEFAAGWNPNLLSPVNRELRFQRWYLSANKTFQDSGGVQRLNVIGGFSFLNDNQFAGGDPSRPSRGYGSFVEVDAIPVSRHLGAYVRYDQLRPTTQLTRSMKAGTIGTAVDVWKYTRLLLEYQRFSSGGASNFFTIGFRVNL